MESIPSRHVALPSPTTPNPQLTNNCGRGLGISFYP